MMYVSTKYSILFYKTRPSGWLNSNRKMDEKLNKLNNRIQWNNNNNRNK